MQFDRTRLGRRHRARRRGLGRLRRSGLVLNRMRRRRGHRRRCRGHRRDRQILLIISDGRASPARPAPHPKPAPSGAAATGGASTCGGSTCTAGRRLSRSARLVNCDGEMVFRLRIAVGELPQPLRIVQHRPFRRQQPALVAQRAGVVHRRARSSCRAPAPRAWTDTGTARNRMAIRKVTIVRGRIMGSGPCRAQAGQKASDVPARAAGRCGIADWHPSSAAPGRTARRVSRRKRGASRGNRPPGSCRDGAPVRPAASLMKRLTMRSSRLWKATTTSRPPGASRLTACASASSICRSSSLTLIRSAWKLRVAGSMPDRSRGMTERMIDGQPPGGLDRRLLARGDDGLGDPPRRPLLAQFDTARPPAPVPAACSPDRRRSSHVFPCACRADRRNGTRTRAAGSSIWNDDTPRSSTTPSSAVTPAPIQQRHHVAELRRAAGAGGRETRPRGWRRAGSPRGRGRSPTACSAACCRIARA